MSKIVAVAVAMAAALADPVAGVAQTPAAAAAERFVLSGVVTVEGGREMAWLQEPTLTRNQVVVARAGDRIGPYRLTRILGDRVELEGPDGITVVPLYNASRGEAPAATASLARSERPAARAARGDGGPVEDAGSAEAVAAERGRRAWARRAEGAGANATSELRNPAARAERRAAERASQAPVASAEGGAAAAQRPAITIPRGDPRQRFTGFGLQ